MSESTVSTEQEIEASPSIFHDQQNRRFLTPKEVIAFCITSFGRKNVKSFVDTWKQYFMMNYMGLSGTAYGSASLITNVWDALDDPVSGVIIDRMRTRWGRLRPFMIMPLPLTLITTMMFFVVPWFIAPQQRFFYALVASILSSISWSYFDAFNLVIYNITPNNNERTKLIATNKFIELFGIWIPSMVPVVVDFLPKYTGIKQQNVYTGFSALFMFILIVSAIYSFKNIRERVPLSAKGDNDTSILQSFKIVLKNRPLFVILLSEFCTGFKGTIGSASEGFFWLNCTGKLTNGTICGLFTGLPNYVITPIAPKLIRRFGARNTAIGAGIFGGIAYTTLFLIGYKPTESSAVNLIFLIFMLTICGLPNCIMGVCDPVLKGDMYDYMEWKSGMRSEGVINAVSGYIAKLSASVQGFLQGFIFDLIHFIPMKDSIGNIVPIKDEKVLFGIFAIFALAPAIARFGYGFSLLLFNVHGKFKNNMLSELEVMRMEKIRNKL